MRRPFTGCPEASLAAMAIAAVGDIDLYFEIHGNGPRVVLINGTGADLRQNPARDRDLLARHHEVLMYDQRGLGRSGKPDRAYTMADYADDCAGLMDHVGWERAHVIGISFGALLGGTVIIESLFAVPGLGFSLIAAINGRDILVIQGITVFIAAMFVIMFIYGWNQYLWPLLVTTDDSYYTIVMGIQRMVTAADSEPLWHLVMATVVLAALPPILVILFMQRLFVKGLTETEK
jgi:hypothetical protein